MLYRGRNLRGLWIGVTLASALGIPIAASAQSPMPDNIDGGLRHLVEARVNAAAAPSVSAARLLEPRVLRDTQSRVLVNVWLDGRHPLPTVHQSLAALGANVSAELATYRQGVIAAYVPVEHAIDAALLPGVRSVTLEHKPSLPRSVA